MKLKQFIKKRLNRNKGNKHYVIRIYENNNVYTSDKFNLYTLEKYLQANWKSIERIDIKLTKSN